MALRSIGSSNQTAPNVTKSILKISTYFIHYHSMISFSAFTGGKVVSADVPGSRHSVHKLLIRRIPSRVSAMKHNPAHISFASQTIPAASHEKNEPFPPPSTREGRSAGPGEYHYDPVKYDRPFQGRTRSLWQPDGSEVGSHEPQRTHDPWGDWWPPLDSLFVHD